MNIQHSTFSLTDYEIRSKGGDGRTLIGLVVPFDVEARIGARYVESFKHGAFAKTVQETRPERVKFLALHNENALPLGATKALREEREGLIGEFKVSRTRAGDEALALVEDGALDAFSVGFVPIKSTWNADRSRVVRNEVRLIEVSLVTIPAYDDARVLAVREADQDAPKGMSLAAAKKIAARL